MSEKPINPNYQVPLFTQHRKIFKFWSQKAESMKLLQETTSNASFFSITKPHNPSKIASSYSMPISANDCAESLTIQRINEIPLHFYRPNVSSAKYHFSPNFYDIKVISSSTLTSLMQSSHSMLIIDCRSSEEYQASHIVSSFKGNSCTSIVHRLFESKKEFVNLISSSAIIVFYCKNGKDLSPFMLRLIRQVDRTIHRDKYPLIAFNELYLLNKGFKAFSVKYPVYNLSDTVYKWP